MQNDQNRPPCCCLISSFLALLDVILCHWEEKCHFQPKSVQIVFKKQKTRINPLIYCWNWGKWSQANEREVRENTIVLFYVTVFVYKHFTYYYLLVQWSNVEFPFPNMDGQNCHLRCLLFSILTNNRISKFQDWCKWVHLVNAIYRQLTDLSPRESIS